MLFVPDKTRSRFRTEREDAVSLSHVMAVLKQARLRPTRQRIALGGLLFRGGHRHVTADELHQEALDAGIALSRATVYNTLNQFSEVGLVRKVSTGSDRTHFDTDIENHQHFYIEAEDRIMDIPAGPLRFDRLPEPPDGYTIAQVDVLIRLVRADDETRRGKTSASPRCENCRACRSMDGV